LPPEASVEDRPELPSRALIPAATMKPFAPSTSDRGVSVGHAPHPWDRMTRFPGEWEPRHAATVVAAPDRAWSKPFHDPSGSVERRREPPRWVTVAFGAAALLGATLLVMWAPTRTATCALSFEAPRRLQLNRPVDREHLAADGASAWRAADRYTSGTSGGDQQRRLLECEDLLVGRIAALHGVSVDQVRAAARSVR
jgi:hypothetical protein